MTEPPDLTDPPARPELEPPLDPEVNELPLAKIPWPEFEKLCLHLVEEVATVDSSNPFGVRGQKQEGIDLYARTQDGSWWAIQCRRVENLTDADVRQAVADFEAGAWRDRADKFILCTSYPAVRTELAEAIVELTEQLAMKPRPVAFEVWDAEAISRRLKNHGELVRAFFGPAWLQAFLPESVRADLDGRLAEIQDAVQRLERKQSETVRVYALSWGPEQIREEFAAIADDDQRLFLRLQDRIGNPPSSNAVVALIAESPPWLTEAAPRAWRVLAALAERDGEWTSAITAWERGAERTTDDFERAGLLVAAAACADVAGLENSSADLLGRARLAAPDHPRIALQELDQSLGGPERLTALAGLESSDPPVAGLIACHRALAHLLVPDVAAARAEYAIAVRENPRAAITRMVGVNVDVQQGRIDSSEHRVIDYAALTRAHKNALTVLDELRAQRRHAESVRVLMLAAEALALVGERDKAASLLLSAEEEERAVPDAAEVLGDAALRAAAWQAALELTDGAVPQLAIRRIRACALAEIGTFPQRQQALETLDAIIEEGGHEAPFAAFFRVIQALAAPPGGQWSEAAAATLKDFGFERPAVVSRAFARAQADGSTAGYQALEGHGNHIWVLLTRLRIALTQRDRDEVARVVPLLLERGPGHDIRVECGRGLLLVGKVGEALQALSQVAADPAAPPSDRADAYALIVPALARREDWHAAQTALQEWLAIRAFDERANPWVPMIANRARSKPRG